MKLALIQLSLIEKLQLQNQWIVGNRNKAGVVSGTFCNVEEMTVAE